MSAVTTHVLDTARGVPAAGVPVRLERVSETGRTEIARTRTGPDGRVPETRVVRVYRDGPRHELRDLNVSTLLRGDFAAAYARGDQAGVLPTDSQKNTCFAYAKEKGVGEIEDYALDLARHFVHDIGPVTAARIEVDEYRWERIPVAGAGHPHAFSRASGDVRTTAVTVAGGAGAGEEGTWIVSGLKDLVVLKSTGSEFAGFLKDRFTTLPETRDRILATSLTARWRYQAWPPAAGWDGPLRRSAGSCWSGSRRCTASRCSRPCGRWAGRCWGRATTSRRSGCPRRTSIISWPTWPRSGWTIPARCSTPPTARTARSSAPCSTTTRRNQARPGIPPRRSPDPDQRRSHDQHYLERMSGPDSEPAAR